MPIRDGQYFLSFEVPEFYMETVDFSFDYPKVKKYRTDLFGAGIVKFDIPKVGKARKVIKFDVPRMRMKEVLIPTPYKTKEDFMEAARAGIDALTKEREKFVEQKELTAKKFDEEIEAAKEEKASAPSIKRLELMKEMEILGIDEAIEIIDEQIELLKAESA